MRAWVQLRYTVPERRAAYSRGLSRLGYTVVESLTSSPGPKDIFLCWNRIGPGNSCAALFERLGLPVLVSENAPWGNSFAGDRWYSIARGRHNTAGCFPIGDNSRWDDLGITLAPWRTEGETVLLPQRGIGSPPTKIPTHWLAMTLKKHGGRVRKHPGKIEHIPLERDLARCGRVYTWGSGAAIKALMMGIPVYSDMPNWIGEQDNTDEGRVAMFRRMAWAQFRLSEIESGEAFARMLG